MPTIVQAVPQWRRRDIIIQTVGTTSSLGYSIQHTQSKLFIKARYFILTYEKPY